MEGRKVVGKTTSASKIEEGKEMFNEKVVEGVKKDENKDTYI